MTTSIPTVAPRTTFLRLLVLTACVAGMGVMAACSTTEGFGEDVGKLGNNIEDSAAKNK